MTTALDRTRALLDTPPDGVIPGQLAVAAETEGDNEHDEQPLVHHQPSLWSL